MLIRINCPNPQCRKQLRIDARHAGKKIACTVCKQHIRLPSAEELNLTSRKSTPNPGQAGEEEIIDFDLLAAQAVIEEKTTGEEASKTEMVEFTCPQCDEKVSLSAENAGKRAPCPSCRRIVAVPKIEGAKPKDWRERQAQGPSLARKEEVKLEGAWGNEQVARVSMEALEEAKALPKVKRKLGVRDYVRYVTYFMLIFSALGVSWWGWGKYRAASIESNTLYSIENAIADSNLPADMNAVLRRGLGEWKLRTGVSDDVRKDGIAELRRAIAINGDPLWTWVLARDTAAFIGPMVSLDVTQPGVVDLQFLIQLLANVRPGEARQDVLRILCRAILKDTKADKLETASTLLTSVIKNAIQPVTITVTSGGNEKKSSSMQDYSGQLSALGVLAQELIRHEGHEGKESALRLLGKTNDRGERALYKKGMPVPKPMVAAMAALAQQDLEVSKDMEIDFELGKMVGYYMSNQDARGKEILQKRKESGLDQANLLSYLDLAEQAIDANRRPEALTCLTDAMSIAQIYTQGRHEAWNLRVYAHVKLCELTARTGEITLAEERVNKLKLDEVPVAAMVARTLIVRCRPVEPTSDDSLLSGLQANSTGQALAAYSVAYKQAQLTKRVKPKLVSAIPEGTTKTMASLGALLGMKLSEITR